jgi:hypothetical protein
MLVLCTLQYVTLVKIRTGLLSSKLLNLADELVDKREKGVSNTRNLRIKFPKT